MSVWTGRGGDASRGRPRGGNVAWTGGMAGESDWRPQAERARVEEKVTIKVKIVNALGLHARPATAFVDVASMFASSITVTKDDTQVDGKSIMQLMLLAASRGSELEICACGADAPKACEALKALVESGFDEE